MLPPLSSNYIFIVFFLHVFWFVLCRRASRCTPAMSARDRAGGVGGGGGGVVGGHGGDHMLYFKKDYG